MRERRPLRSLGADSMNQADEVAEPPKAFFEVRQATAGTLPAVSRPVQTIVGQFRPPGPANHIVGENGCAYSFQEPKMSQRRLCVSLGRRRYASNHLGSTQESHLDHRRVAGHDQLRGQVTSAGRTLFVVDGCADVEILLSTSSASGGRLLGCSAIAHTARAGLRDHLDPLADLAEETSGAVHFGELCGPATGEFPPERPAARTSSMPSRRCGARRSRAPNSTPCAGPKLTAGRTTTIGSSASRLSPRSARRLISASSTTSRSPWTATELKDPVISSFEKHTVACTNTKQSRHTILGQRET